MRTNESEEMYLETIYLLKRREINVHAVDIATELNYSRPSVSRAIGLLKDRGYITVDSDRGISFTEEGETVGAIFHAPDYLPSEKGVIISFNCEDIDQTLEKVLRKGGKIMMPKTKIEVEGRGWFALFADSEGNRVGLYADK